MLTALGLCCLVSEAVFAIQPADVAIVYNRNMPASQEVAEFYCEKRGVPRSNIVRLDLPITEDINIADYRQKHVWLLRAAVQDRKDRIQVLLCVDGVTLNVGANGPVTEPFTLGFPKPAEFFGFLVTGECTLVECYARTLNVTSWMCTLIGDPLYNPYKASPRIKSTLRKSEPQRRQILAGFDIEMN